MDTEENNGSGWDKNFVVALIGLIVSFILGGLALLFTVATPELRNCFGLKDGNTPAPLPTPAAPAPPLTVPKQKSSEQTRPSIATVPKIQQHVEKTKPPTGPFSATLHENQTQFVEEAETRLSILFNEEYKIVTLTIAPDGKPSSNRAVLNGYTEEFASSAGDFLVHILNVDWNSRTVTVQVSRKS